MQLLSNSASIVESVRMPLAFLQTVNAELSKKYRVCTENQGRSSPTPAVEDVWAMVKEKPCMSIQLETLYSPGRNEEFSQTLACAAARAFAIAASVESQIEEVWQGVCQTGLVSPCVEINAQTGRLTLWVDPATWYHFVADSDRDCRLQSLVANLERLHAPILQSEQRTGRTIPTPEGWEASLDE